MQPTSRLSFLALLAASTLARAQDVRVVETPPFELAPATESQLAALAHPTPATDARRVALSRPIERVYWDELEGVVWAMGRDYKASFGPEGATITPFLGSDAPRNYPVTFALSRATIGGEPVALAPAGHASRADATVRFERGPIDEVYDVSLGSIEQSFDVAARLGAGDLVVDVAWASELEGTRTADGLRFANERGGLDYTGAIAVDARGRVLELESDLVEGAIRLTVPAAFLDDATYPVRVDPTVATYSISAVAAYELAPDVAYDELTTRALMVWERVYSATDHDVFYQVVHPEGWNLTSDFVDFTSTWWGEPSIATKRGVARALIVCTVGDPATGTSAIGGRAASNEGPMMTIQFNLSAAESGSKSQPDVGGDATNDPARPFLVAWTRTLSPTSQRVNLRLVGIDGALVPFGAVELPSFTEKMYRPRVSNSNDGDAWSIVCNAEVTPTNHDVVLVHYPINAVGIVAAVISQSADDDLNPSVSTMVDGSTRYVIAFERRIASNSNVALLLMRDGLTVEAAIDVNFNDGQGAPDSVFPAVETDGSHLLFAYTKRPGALQVTELGLLQTAPPTFTNVDTVEAELGVDEGARMSSLNAVGAVSRRQAIAVAKSGTIWLTLADGRVGGDYDAVCFGDGTSGACPCANEGFPGHGCGNSIWSGGALLAGSGNAVLGPDTFTLTARFMPNSTSLFFQGNGLAAAPPAFGDGLLCAASSVVRLGTKFNVAGEAQYPGPGDQPISVRGLIPAAGGIRYYQTWYRNAASFCSASTFNLTNAIGAAFTP